MTPRPTAEELAGYEAHCYDEWEGMGSPPPMSFKEWLKYERAYNPNIPEWKHP